MQIISQSVSNTIKDMTLLDMVENSQPEESEAVPGV
jgi:hypothetical protein